jgi:hypothetical protein
VTPFDIAIPIGVKKVVHGSVIFPFSDTSTVSGADDQIASSI